MPNDRKPGNSVNERYLDWLNKSKTLFPVQKHVGTTFNLGQLTPLSFFEALPGDTYALTMSSLFRIVSPLTKAALETLNVHFACFTVPLRILYENFKKVMGERDDYELEPDSSYSIPEIKFVDENGQPVNNYAKSILAYLSVPIPSAEDIRAGRVLRGLNKCLSNAYAMIWNEHFRDQNLQQGKHIDISDNDIHMIAEGDADANWHTSAPDKYTGKLASVNRDFDYFSNVFTDTQKGEKATLSLAGEAPVVIGGAGSYAGISGTSVTEPNHPLVFDSGIPFVKDENIGALRPSGNSAVLSGLTSGAELLGIGFQTVSNLDADLSNVSSFSINDLRELEHLQKRRELDLVAGTRYFEIVDNYFNVKNALAELDVPQWVSYSKGQIHISQVVQTSGGIPNETTDQGNIAGYGVGANNHGSLNVMVKEHSLIIPFIYVTQNHRYQQGLHKFFTRKTKEDFFDTLQIGNGFQPIYKSEIYGHLTEKEKDDIWAYAPNAERYRKETDVITGQLNVNAKDSISAWHAGDVYNAPPIYDKNWKIEIPDYFDRCLVYPSDIADQFLVDVFFNGVKVSVVDPLGIPYI